MMKLYLYDHCPYCVRVRMIFGLHQLENKEVCLSYDDEETPTQLIGRKLVPILVKEDGQAMGESLDIVRFIDENYGQKSLAEDIRPEVEAWLAKILANYNKLTSPRVIKAGLPEFESQKAVDYYVTKKTPLYGDFAESLASSEELIAEMNADLLALEKYIKNPEDYGKWGYEDIILFPLLRNLTIVKNLQFPAKVESYLAELSRATGVPTYHAQAL